MRCDRRVALLILAGAVCVADRAAAQALTVRVTGTVSDASGRPVVAAAVTMTGATAPVLTDSTGVYRLSGPARDTAVLVVRRMGYRVRVMAIRLQPGETVVNVELEDAPQRLDAVVTAATRTGVFGVVGDTAFNVLVGARVSLAGRVGESVTDSTGAFIIDPVRAGANLLEVRAYGFRPRLVSFTVPPNGGVQLAVWMTPVAAGLDAGAIGRASDFGNLLKADLADFDRRQRWRTTQTAVASREQLSSRAPHAKLSDAVAMVPELSRRGVRVRAADGSGAVHCAIVDGVAVRDPDGNILDWYNADDVESIELYPPNSDWSDSLKPCTGPPAMLSRGFTNPIRTRAASPRGRSGGSFVIAVIFLRR